MAGTIMIVVGSVLISVGIILMIIMNIVLLRRKRRIREQIYSMYE